MTARQKLEIRRSEIRKRLGEISELTGDALTEEITGERDGLMTELRDSESQLQAAIAAETRDDQLRGDQRNHDGEGAELRDLQARFSMGRVVDVLSRRGVQDGAEKELQDHFNLEGNQIPLESLRLAEHRAVTPGPTNTGADEMPVVLPVFSEGDAAYLGVDMPMVPNGEAVFPVLTSRPTVGGPHTDSTDAADTTGAFDAESLPPARLQAAFFYRRTDAARFQGMEESLRSALNMGLSEAMDKEVVDQIIADSTRGDAAAVNTFATYRSAFVYDHIDGRFASMESDLRLLVGAATLTHMSTAYRSNNADDSAVDSVRSKVSGLRVSPHIAAVSGNKQDALVRRGMRRDIVAPTWRGVEIIYDEITKAGTGEIQITAVLLAAFKVIRTGGVIQQQVQHA